jgi:hypothetical protein
MFPVFRSTRSRSTARQINQRKRYSFESLENRMLMAADISISDAFAIEGDNSFKFLETFISSNPQGIADPPAPSGAVSSNAAATGAAAVRRHVPADIRLNAIDFIFATDDEAVSRRSWRVGRAMHALAGT